MVTESRTAPITGNIVPYPDQALFLALRGAGQEAVMQGIWLYEHPVDIDGIKRFHHNLGHGLLGRRMEPSPLPFGRHRWVSPPGPEDNLDVYTHPRERSALYEWADEQVALPLDPEHGPAWRMGVVPFSDGSTAVSLVISHCIADGSGSFMAVLEAVHGATRDLGYPCAGARPRGRAVRQDLRQVIRDLPEVVSTLGRAVKIGWRRRKDIARPVPGEPAAGDGDDVVHMPSASIFIDTRSWDTKAEELGGNSFSLVAGFAGRLSANLGRVRSSDGAVTLMIPVNEREDLQNTGGNVVSIANLSFDPKRVTTDLSDARTAIREALKRSREVPDEMVELVPLIPFVPKRGIAKIADVAFGFSTDVPVSCSNFGDIPQDLMRVDGTQSKYLCFRGVDRQVSKAALEKRGGALTVTAGRLGDFIAITVISYQPGRENSLSDLREMLVQTLTEFGLTGSLL